MKTASEYAVLRIFLTFCRKAFSFYLSLLRGCGVLKIDGFYWAMHLRARDQRHSDRTYTITDWWGINKLQSTYICLYL